MAAGKVVAKAGIASSESAIPSLLIPLHSQGTTHPTFGHLLPIRYGEGIIGFAAEATPPAPPPRRPTPFALPPPPPSPALVGPVGDTDVRLGWHDPLPPTSTLPRFVPFCLERMAEFGGLLTVLDPHCAGLVT